MARTPIDLPTDLSSRAQAVAEDLRRTLSDVATAAVGSQLRPSRLGQELDLDKSLASRLVRGIRAKSPYELLHAIPSPTGLGMFLSAAAERGVEPATLDSARQAVDAFQRLLDDVPEGRSGLFTLISENTVEVRERAERTAKQAVYKAMSHLLGFSCETITSALILTPSADGAVDGIDIGLRSGIRRLRPSTPVAVFSIDLPPTSGHGPRLETLEGESNVTDPMAFCLPDFCHPSPPAVDLFQEGTHTIFALSEERSSVDRPVTITTALRIREGWRGYRENGITEDGRSYLLHYPCKLLVRDLYLHEDVYAGALPEVRLEFPSPTGPAKPRSANMPERINTLDISAPIEQLGKGEANMPLRGVPEHAELLSHVFAEADLDPDAFRGYRTRIVYPVPMITMGWWVPLEEMS